jgi:hypothetical protein
MFEVGDTVVYTGRDVGAGTICDVVSVNDDGTFDVDARIMGIVEEERTRWPAIQATKLRKFVGELRPNTFAAMLGVDIDEEVRVMKKGDKVRLTVAGADFFSDEFPDIKAGDTGVVCDDFYGSHYGVIFDNKRFACIFLPSPGGGWWCKATEIEPVEEAQ